MTPAPAPAGLVQRYAAWSLDAAIVLALALAACAPRIADGGARLAAAFDGVAAAAAQVTIDVLLHGAMPTEAARGLLSDPAHAGAIAAFAAAIGAVLWPPLLAFALLALPWFVAFEASRWQATPGKRLLGLRVVDAHGARIGIVRAALRHLAGTLSWLTLNIGHLLAAAAPAHAALHDRLAGTRVVALAGTASRLPGWAWAWIALQAIVGLGALLWLFVVADAAMQRAFDAML